MPRSWMHVQWNTYGSWLPGDPRGFRNRDHRIHSSGTYKTPPPPGEHAELHRYARHRLKRPPLVLSPKLRVQVMNAVLEKTALLDIPLEVIAVGGEHVHVLIFLDDQIIKPEIGKLKRHSSHAIGNDIPGTVWSAGCFPKHVENQEYWLKVVEYILDHRLEGAAVWRRSAQARLASADKFMRM